METEEHKTDLARSGRISQPGGSKGSYNNRILDWLKLAFWILLVVALGMLAVNQTLGFFYKAHFLKAPCDLCAELNPGVEQCIANLNTGKPSYWTPEGWSDPWAENETEGKIKINLTNFPN